jgi:succinate dehydrogenase / fumarate reductase membrane anchor subunit
MEETLSPRPTVANPPAPRATSAWIWQAVSGTALIALAGLHMFANHFVVQGGLRDYQQVVDYLRNPVILVLEVLFLFTVTWHAVLGIRAVIFDLGLSEAAEQRVTQVMWVIGVLTVAYGLWLTWIIIR